MRRRAISISVYRNREYVIKNYFTFLGSIGKRSLYSLNGDTLARYLAYLKQNNYTVWTQRNKLKDLKAFYNWLIAESLITTKNEIFNRFCIHAYIGDLHNIYAPQVKQEAPSAVRKEVRAYIDRFIGYYLNKGYSELGTRIYRRELIRFIGYLEKHSSIQSIKEVTKNLLSEYQLYIFSLRCKDGVPLSASTRQKKLVVIRRFFKFLTQYDYLDKDPATIIELPRVDRGLPTRLMNERELELFLDAADTTTPRGLRDRTIMEVLYSTGIRNNELCHLRLDDVDIKGGLVTVTHPKGGLGYQRVIPIGKVACEHIKRYVEESRPRLLSGQEDSSYLFLNNLGRELRRTTLTAYMAMYRLKGNIKNKIGTHSFRVTCATAMLKNGADVRYIQQQLGHRSLRSTQIYTRVCPKDLKKVHQATHPREKTYKKHT